MRVVTAVSQINAMTAMVIAVLCDKGSKRAMIGAMVIDLILSSNFYDMKRIFFSLFGLLIIGLYVLESCLKVNAYVGDKESFDKNVLIADRIPIDGRLTLFRTAIGQYGFSVKSNADLLDFRTAESRRALSVITGIPEKIVTRHIELADLVRIGIPENEAQLLLFSQIQSIDPFTYEVLGSGLLPQSDPVFLKMNVDQFAQQMGFESLGIDEILAFQSLASSFSPTLSYGIDHEFVRGLDTRNNPNHALISMDLVICEF
ncbi:MAG: hypothetical protein AAF731_07800 [Bacteroidota bacterium]